MRSDQNLGGSQPWTNAATIEFVCRAWTVDGRSIEKSDTIIELTDDGVILYPVTPERDGASRPQPTRQKSIRCFA
jgi:hypothetical protein